MNSIFLPYKMGDLWEVKQKDPEAIILAGGTGLLVFLREKGLHPHTIVGLENLWELKQIEMQNGEIRIGAMVTHQQLLESPVIQAQLPGLHQAVTVLGYPPIRHMGTIGGNICTASPAGDTLPSLYVLNAVAELRTPTASRLLPIQDLIKGPGQNVLGRDEILYQIRIPVPSPSAVSFYFKVGQRKALAISVCSLASMLQVAEDEQTIVDCRFAWGSVGPTIMRFPGLEKNLIGEKLSLNKLREFGQTAASMVSPITDIRGSAEYRRMLVSNLPSKMLQTL